MVSILWPLLVLAPGLTEGEVLGRVKAAYLAAGTLSVSVKLAGDSYPATADIQFQRPGKLRVKGRTGFETPYELLVLGDASWVFNAGKWTKMQGADLGIASIAGISGLAGSTLPPLLLNRPLYGMEVADKMVRAKVEKVGSAEAFVLNTRTQTVWVDAKTFYILRTKATAGGVTFDSSYGPTVVGKAIPADVFVAPKI